MGKQSWVKVHSDGNYGKFIAEPLEKGYGITLGNSLRRILLSSLEGAAITAVQVDGVTHEYEQVKNMVEDTLDLILNIKGIIIKSHSSEAKEVTLSYKGKGDIKAKDIEHDGEIEIINPDHHIGTLSESGKLNITFWVEKGKGYVTSESNKKPDQPLNVIPVDSNFSPVTKVNMNIENTRVGKQTDLDKLILEVWTNGSVSPEEAVQNSARILIENFNMFVDYNQKPQEEAANVPADQKAANIELTLEDLELSARSSNCLKKAGINTLELLLNKDIRELMQIKNFGKKSADEIDEKLAQFGLKLKDSGLADEAEEQDE